MPFLLALLLIVPLLELAVILQVGSWIGLWPTIVLLLLDSLLGALLLKSQGRASWGRLRQALDDRRLPHKEAADGGLVILGGSLLLTPGFITDLMGFLLLIRPVRDKVAHLTLNRSLDAAAASLGGSAGLWGMRSARFRSKAFRRPQYDAEGSAEEIPEYQLPAGK